MTEGSSRTVCVLGFGRSGTSLTTRILSLLGAEIGREQDLLRPQPEDNPRGYWEPQWLVELNDEILAELGTTWHQPFPRDPGWERDPRLAPLRARAQALLDERLGGLALRVVKDPRLTLTLPLWRPLLGETSYVVCVRNPLDAAASLRRRPEPDRSIAAWCELWLEYTARALHETAGAPRILVFYEDLHRDGAVQVARLARLLGVPPEGERTERAAAEVVGELRHHATTPLELSAARAPAAARLVFLALRAAHGCTTSPGRYDAELSEAVERVAFDLWQAAR